MHFLLPRVRIELFIRTMLTRTWAPEALPLVKPPTACAVAGGSADRRSGLPRLSHRDRRAAG
jgi:hypothetical protein